MSITVTINASLQTQGGTTVSGSQQETGGTEVDIDTNFASGSTNVAQAGAWTAANVQAVIMLADKACTVKTNSSSTPANTFNLIPGYPLVWDKSSSYFTNPFSADVTQLFVTCTAATRLRIKVLTNP